MLTVASFHSPATAQQASITFLWGVQLIITNANLNGLLVWHLGCRENPRWADSTHSSGDCTENTRLQMQKAIWHEREATGQRRKRYLKITMNKDRERVKKSFGSLLVTTSWLQAQATVNLLNGDSHWLSLCFTMAWPPVEAARVHTWPDMRRISSPGHHLHTTGSGQWVLNRAAKKNHHYG